MSLRFSEEEYQRYVNRQAKAVLDATRMVTGPAIMVAPLPSPAPEKKPAQKSKMTKTEMEAKRMLQMEFPRREIGFESIRLKLRNGHFYTPDLVVPIDDSRLLLVEVKGSYKLGSYQRARMAYDQAKVDYPQFAWRWLEKTKDGWKDSWRESI